MFTKLFPHLLDSVRPDGVVLLVCDGGQLLLQPPLLLFHCDGTIEVTPVLENVTIALQLPDLVKKGVSSSGQHEIEVKICLLSFGVWVLDLGDHLVVGRVGAEVGEGDHDAAILQVVTGADVLWRQGDIQLREGKGLNVTD